MRNIKDSGKRIQMKGMVRDTAEDKVKYDLVLDGPMFERWAQHMTTGAKKYAARNWMGAESQEELDRFKESALRHFIQWYRGDFDEDHAAAVFFNINGVEYVKNKQTAVSISAPLNATATFRQLLREQGLLNETEVVLPWQERRRDEKDRRRCQDPSKAEVNDYRRAGKGRRSTDKGYGSLPYCNYEGRTGAADRRKCKDLAQQLAKSRRADPYGRRKADRPYEDLPICKK